MKYIRSRNNPVYRSALKLTKKKFRDESGMYLTEGLKPLKDALEMGIHVETVFVCEGKEDVVSAKNCNADLAPAVLSRELFNTISDTNNSIGVISVVCKEEITPGEFSGLLRRGGNVVVLDRLQDPGNTGTIIRTAEAAGYGGIIAMKGTCDVYSPKVVRAAAGSLLRMPVATGWNIETLEEFAKKAGMKIAVSCPDDAVNCFETDLNDKIALVIGNEGQGVSRELKDIADIRVRIPMAGAIESLNAAVAAGILMYRTAGGNI